MVQEEKHPEYQRDGTPKVTHSLLVRSFIPAGSLKNRFQTGHATVGPLQRPLATARDFAQRPPLDNMLAPEGGRVGSPYPVVAADPGATAGQPDLLSS